MGALRDIAKRLPWGMRKTAAFFALHGSGLIFSRRFDGIYQSFDDLPASFPDEAIAGHAFNNAIRPKMDELSGTPILRQHHALLPTVVSMTADRSKTFRVLDFGGGAGLDYSNLSYAIPRSQPISYTVVELPALCNAGRKLWSGDSRIAFSETLPPTGTEFDLVYSWSALEFHAQPLEVLEKFASYKPKAILIAHTPMVSASAFVRGQYDARSNSLFPVWVLSIAELERVLLANGYRLAMHSCYDDDYPVDNFDAQHKVPHTVSLLFLPN
jgi:putative methyltransferase (TIGR04325 family)